MCIQYVCMFVSSFYILLQSHHVVCAICDVEVVQLIIYRKSGVSNDLSHFLPHWWKTTSKTHKSLHLLQQRKWGFLQVIWRWTAVCAHTRIFTFTTCHRKDLLQGQEMQMWGRCGMQRRKIWPYIQTVWPWLSCQLVLVPVGADTYIMWQWRV